MSTCTRCGAFFSCAMVDAGPACTPSTPAPPCWCTLLPAAVAVPAAMSDTAAVGCWCPACLTQHIAAVATAPGAN